MAAASAGAYPRNMFRGHLTLVLALAMGGTAALVGAARVHPLISTSLTIRAVAQDGDHIAWISGPCNSVRVRARGGGSPTVVGNALSVDCGPVVPPRLALAGSRALWTNTSAGNNVYTDVMTGSPGRRQRRLEQTVGASGGGDGDYFTDLAGDGSTLVYSTVTMTMLDTCIDPGTPCLYFVDSGRVKRVVGRTVRRVPNVPPAVTLAVSGCRLALVVAAHDSPYPDPSPSGRVEVRNATTGTLVLGFTVSGTALDVALGQRILAVLVRRLHQPVHGGLVIESRAATTGAVIGNTAVPTNATNLSVASSQVVRVGRSIRILDAVTGETRELAVATSTPIGLSAEGRWAVWAERRGRARIVSVPFD